MRNVPINVTDYNIQISAFFKSRNLIFKKILFCDHFNVKQGNGEIIFLLAIINSIKPI